MKKTGKLDKNGVEIREDHKIKYLQPWEDESNAEFYYVRYGIGTFSQYHKYIGFFLERIDPEHHESFYTDGYGNILTEDSENLEVINNG